MITLFILPGDPANSNPQKTFESFGSHVTKSYQLKNKDLQKFVTELETEWYAYLFENEYIDKSLREALNVYLKEPRIDCIAFFKRNQEETKLYITPRLFRREIILKEDQLIPLNAVRTVNALDGWLKDNEFPSRSNAVST